MDYTHIKHKLLQTISKQDVDVSLEPAATVFDVQNTSVLVLYTSSSLFFAPSSSMACDTYLKIQHQKKGATHCHGLTRVC